VKKENLKSLQSIFKKVNFISYFTVKPDPDEVNAYINQVQEEVLHDRDDHFYLLGRRTADIETPKNSKQITIYKDLLSLTSAL